MYNIVYYILLKYHTSNYLICFQNWGMGSPQQPMFENLFFDLFKINQICVSKFVNNYDSINK